MSVLIVIGIIMFILALINWGQSQGHFDRFLRLFDDKSSSITSLGNGSVVIGNSEFALDEDYAYDDDLDYFGDF